MAWGRWSHCKLVHAVLVAGMLTGAAQEQGRTAPTLLNVRPARRALGWLEKDCWGDIEYVVDLLNPRLRPDKPLELRIEIVNHCHRCNKQIRASSRLWVEDGQVGSAHFSKASSPLDMIECHERRYVVMNIFPARRNEGISQLPVRMNISLQDPRGYDLPEGLAIVDVPFYAYQPTFEAKEELNILGIGPPGVGKTTYIMSMMSALLSSPQQLQNVGGATVDGHTTQMITQYPLADWTENPGLRINFWDTWGVRPQNFTTDLLTALCEGLVPHGFQMQAYEQGEKRFRKSTFTSVQQMDVVLFFLRADQVKHPEGLPVVRNYLNHVKALGYGAILVVTWLHAVPNADALLADVKRQLQIPVLPFAKGCHPNCKVQPPLEVSSIAAEKDPEVDKHALVVLEWAKRLANSAARVRRTASLSSNAWASYRNLSSHASRFWQWLLSAAWGGETAIFLGLSLLASLLVAGRSGWALLAALHVELAGVPAHRRRELVSAPALRTLLVALSLLYSPVQQSLPSTEIWAAHGSYRCAAGVDTVPISSQYSGTSDVTNRKCRDECLNEPECTMYAFGSSEGYFSTRGMHCELYKSCELQHYVGTTVFERPVQSWLVSISAFAYIAQMVINFLRLICIQCSGACLMCTVVLCLLSVHLCCGAPPSSRFGLMLMLHLANLLVLLAMNQNLQECLQAVTNEETGKEQRLKDLEVMLFHAARRHGASLRDRQTWRAQVDLFFGLALTACTVGFLAYCAVSFSGGDDIWAYNLANLVTRLVVGVQFQALVRACVLVTGAFVLASPLVVGLRQVQRGLLGLLEDQQAELERSAALIAVKAFTVEKLLSCLKHQLSMQSEITRMELEEMADDLCLRRSSPDRSALICASATYFRHGPEDATASKALEAMVSVRAVDLLQERVDAARVTSEMLFAHGDLCAELTAAEGQASERFYSICQLLVDILKTVSTGGLYLLFRCRRRSQSQAQPLLRCSASDHVAQTIRRVNSEKGKKGKGRGQMARGRAEDFAGWGPCAEDTEQRNSPPKGGAGILQEGGDEDYGTPERCKASSIPKRRKGGAPKRFKDGEASGGEELKATREGDVLRHRTPKQEDSDARLDHA